MVYLFIIAAIFLLRGGIAGKGYSINYQFYCLISFFLFIVSAFRYQVGCDWGGYYNQFSRAGHGDIADIIQNREPIWWMVLEGQKYLSLPYPFINVISSAIFFLGIHRLAKRQPDPLGFLALTFPILIINMPMSGIRQGAAIGLMCCAYLAFIDRRTLRYVFWVLLASGFHSSAAIFLLFSPLVGGAGLSVSRFLAASFLSVPGIVLMSQSSSADIAIDRYISGDREAFGAIFRIIFLSITGLYFLIFQRRNWRSQYKGDYSLALVGSISMIFIALLLPVSSVIADRLGYYLSPLQAILLSKIPFLGKEKKLDQMSIVPYVFLIIFFIVWAANSWHFQKCYLPYQTWLFGFPNGL